MGTPVEQEAIDHANSLEFFDVFPVVFSVFFVAFTVWSVAKYFYYQNPDNRNVWLLFTTNPVPEDKRDLHPYTLYRKIADKNPEYNDHVWYLFEEYHNIFHRYIRLDKYSKHSAKAYREVLKKKADEIDDSFTKQLKHHDEIDRHHADMISLMEGISMEVNQPSIITHTSNN